MLDAVSDDDVQTIVAKLVKMAKSGSVAAIKEILDRTIGKPQAAMSVDLSVDTADSDRVAIVSEVRQLRLALLTEPDYLEFHRSRALAEDVRDDGPSGESIER